VERLGALGDGGKWVCGLSRVAQKPDCIVYSFGKYSKLVVCNYLLTRKKIHLTGINYESSFENEILSNTDNCEIWGYDFSVTSFGPQIPKSLQYRTHFKPFGLSGSDKHGPDDEQPMYTLETLMKINGKPTVLLT
jgi:Methyltransferase domain